MSHEPSHSRTLSSVHESGGDPEPNSPLTKAMTAVRGQADLLCSVRAFPLMTQLRHARLVGSGQGTAGRYHFVYKVDDNNPRKSAHETPRRMPLEIRLISIYVHGNDAQDSSYPQDGPSGSRELQVLARSARESRR